MNIYGLTTTRILIIIILYKLRDGGVVLSRVVSFSAGAPAGGFLAPHLFSFGVAMKTGLCWWAFAASRAPQFSAPVFLACFSVLEPASREGFAWSRCLSLLAPPVRTIVPVRELAP